jgi:endonuclease YncB( thermonuclease family)
MISAFELLNLKGLKVEVITSFTYPSGVLEGRIKLVKSDSQSEDLIEVLLREGICKLDESFNIDESKLNIFKKLEIEAKSKGLGIWKYEMVENIDVSRLNEL